MTMVPDAAAPEPLRPAAALFRSLADPARLAIVRRLAGGPARVVDLTRALGLAQSTVSGHLSCLREHGLVTVRPQGRASVYTLARPALLDLLAAAETVLRETEAGAAPAAPAPRTPPAQPARAPAGQGLAEGGGAAEPGHLG